MVLGTFFTITEADVGMTIGYMKDLIIDLTPFLTLIIGVAVGLIIFTVIVNTIRGGR